MNNEEQAALDKVKPICDKCKHSEVDDWGEYKCHREITYSADNVSGRVWSNIPTCRNERDGYGKNRCGVLGKFYEEQEEAPKKPWLDRLIDFLHLNFEDEDSLV